MMELIRHFIGGYFECVALNSSACHTISIDKQINTNNKNETEKNRPNLFNEEPPH